LGQEENLEKISDQEILKILAPNSVENTLHSSTASVLRRKWIRGARFLTEDNLGVLVDTGIEKEDARKEVLADLLGVRELRERAAKYRKYEETIKYGYHGKRSGSAYRGLVALKKDLEQKRAEWQEKLRQAELRQRRDTYSAEEVALEELGKAVQHIENLGVASGRVELDVHDLQRSMTRVSAKLKTAVREVDDLKGALNYVFERWNEIKNLESTLEQDTKEQQTLSVRIAERDKEISNKETEFRREKGNLASCEDKLKNIVQEYFRIQHSIGELVDRMERCIDPQIRLFKVPSINQLVSVLEQLWTDDQSFSVLKDILFLREQRNEHLARTNRLGEQRAEILMLEKDMPSEEKIAYLRTAVTQCNSALQEAKAKHDAISGPLEPLRLAVQRFIDSAEGVRECPVCGHDWKTAQMLRNTLSDTLASVPQPVKQSAEKVLIYERELAKAKDLLQQAKGQCDKVENLKHAIRNLECPVEEYLSVYRRLATNCGFNMLPINDPSWHNMLEALESRILVGRAVAAFMLEWQQIREYLDEKEILGLPIPQLQEKIEEDLKSRRSSLENKIETVKENVRKLEISLEALKRNRDNEKSTLENLRKRIDDIVPLIETFSEAWHKISVDCNPSEEALEAARSTIHKCNDRVTAAALHFAAAETAQKSIRAEGEAKQLGEEVQKLQNAVKLLTHRKEQAAHAASQLEKMAEEHIHHQFKQLAEVFWPIFWRLQANEFYEAIEPGPPDSPLKWKARARSKDFDPSQYFSMGQRQDFALAIFLARARGLGGTFFLDEPIIHLDDLNRVALLDMFRVLATEANAASQFVVTTASKPLVRHMSEKFVNLPRRNGVAPLRIYELDGNPRVGVRISSDHAIGL